MLQDQLCLYIEFTDVNSTVNVKFVTEIDFKSEYNNPSSLQYKSLKKDIQIQVSRLLNTFFDVDYTGSYIIYELQLLYKFGYMCVSSYKSSYLL